MSCMSMRLIPQGSLLLAGAWVREITRTLPGLIQHTDYYTLMIVQMGSARTFGHELESMNSEVFSNVIDSVI